MDDNNVPSYIYNDMLNNTCQAWCAMKFLLISFKTDKDTFTRCLSISGHGNLSRSGKLIPPFWYPVG